MSSKNKLKKTHSNSRECDICISLVGPVGCGKSALLVKYITHRFLGEYDTFYGCFFSNLKTLLKKFYLTLNFWFIKRAVGPKARILMELMLIFKLWTLMTK